MLPPRQITMTFTTFIVMPSRIALTPLVYITTLDTVDQCEAFARTDATSATDTASPSLPHELRT